MLSVPRLVAIVDDEESVRRALVRLFNSADFRAVAFPSARAFVQALETITVDCLVLDLQMPEMTGLDLQHLLRTEYPDLHIPVVIITAHDEPDMRERCIAAGAVSYLRKPVDSNTLLGAVTAVTSPPGENGKRT